MNNEFCTIDHADAVVERSAPVIMNNLNAKGKYTVEHIRDGEVIGEYEFPNGIVDQGLNSILGVYFHSDTQILTTSWFIGLIDNSGFTALANSDTLASHTGWNEFTTYTGTRLAWAPGASATRSITNATTVNFPITGSGTLKGIFICSATSGTTGTLWSTAAFGTTVTVASGDTLKVTYTVSG